MQRIIAGATGLIGNRLTAHWINQGHKVIAIGRTKAHIESVFGNRVQALTWNELTSEILQASDVVVNLAGANIAEKPWSPARKQEVLSSRIDSTKQLAELLAGQGAKAPPLFNANAIGIYGLQAQREGVLPPALDENAVIAWNNPPDFLSRIGTEWQQAATTAIESNVRVIFMRFGVVLTKEGGALPQLVRPFKMFLGGTIGSGNQPFSWIAMDDVVRAIDFLLTKPDATGPFNFVAPECVTERQLAKAIAKTLHKPAAFPMPGKVMKLLLGNEMAQELLLEGQHVYPKRLLDLGFKFDYPTIESALGHILKGRP